MFAICSRPSLTLKDATVVSTYSGTIFKTAYDATLYKTASGTTEQLHPCDANVYMENCRFYTEGTAISEAYESDVAYPEYEVQKSEIAFKNCYFACKAFFEKSVSSGSPTYTDCYFTTPELQSVSENILGTSQKNEFILKTLEFNYTDATLDSNEPFTLKTGTQSVTYNRTTKPADSYATITWVGFNGAVVSEPWESGTGIIPTPPNTPDFLPKTTEAYTYRFTPEIAEVKGDATYTLSPTLNFVLKANLTLYADFVYNIYLPREIGDSKDLNFVTLDGVESPLSKTVTIEGKEYYVIENHIPAQDGDKTFDFSVNITTPTGILEKSWTFSIPDYVEKVNSGNYSENAKAMVNSAMTYVKAASNYQNEPDIYTVTGLTHISGVKAEEMSEDMRTVFYGMNLNIKEKINFRFYIYDDISLSENKISFTYPQSNVRTTVTLTPDDLTKTDYVVSDRSLSYYEFEMKAFDLRDKISIRLGDPNKETPDFTYSLANYVYYANDESEEIEDRAALTTLMDAMWAYSIASEEYIKNATSDSPEIDITIDGKKINAIVANSDEEIAAANKLANEIYAVSGAKPEIVKEDTADGNIVISLITPTPECDCSITVENGDLVMNCSYKSLLENAVGYFAAEYITPLSNNFDFEDTFSQNYYTDRIYYSDFGAAGDGKTDDFFAIKAAHDYANIAKRYTVCADSGKSYYISNTRSAGTTHTVSIKTNVDWADAKFTIDDSKLSVHTNSAIIKESIFRISSDYAESKITNQAVLNAILENGLNRGTTRIDLGFDYPVMIVPYNSSHMIYRRRGYSAWAGEAMHEIILLDENGFVDDSTPVMFDYTALDSITVYRVDDTPVTVEGGEFTTIASDIDCVVRDENGFAVEIKEHYIERGLKVSRSHTTVKNVKHFVEGEISLDRQKNGEVGAPYRGFFQAITANEVTFEGCVLSAKRCYNKSLVQREDGTRFSGTKGTYGISADRVNKLVYKNCTQANFWVITEEIDENTHVLKYAKENDPNAVTSMAKNSFTNSRMYWGIGGTNYCKNMSYINSTLSRFDAHQGLYNGEVVGSVVNAISLTGQGKMLIKDTRCIGQSAEATDNAVFSLRSDYGSTWDGTVTVDNVDVLVYATSEDKTAEFGVVSNTYTNWYYGYVCHFPNLVINNLKFHNSYKYYRGDSDTLLSSDVSVRLLAQNVLDSEPNIHLDTTLNRHPIFPDVDNDGDENNYVDGTEIIFDGQTDASGVVDTTSNQNLNPTKPPKTITVTNNPHGEYNFQFDVSTFFKSTTITVNGELINKGYDLRPTDSPVADYN